MKFLIDNWALLMVALSSGGLLLWPALVAGAGSGLAPSAAVLLINREKAVVVDVGDDAEFAAGHVVGARHVPMALLPSKLAEVAKNKAQPLLMVCTTGSRARRAAATARKLGYANAQVLGGGLNAWREAGLPIEKT